MNIGFCRVAILDNILMYEKNLELLHKLRKDGYKLVYVGSELRELLDIEDLNLDILVIGNLGSKGLPILAMTAHGHVAKDENIRKQGFNDYVLKPFEPKDLFYKIIYYLNQSL